VESLGSLTPFLFVFIHMVHDGSPTTPMFLSVEKNKEPKGRNHLSFKRQKLQVLPTSSQSEVSHTGCKGAEKIRLMLIHHFPIPNSYLQIFTFCSKTAQSSL
jgi:hypothetical protein